MHSRNEYFFDSYVKKLVSPRACLAGRDKGLWGYKVGICVENLFWSVLSPDLLKLLSNSELFLYQWLVIFEARNKIVSWIKNHLMAIYPGLWDYLQLLQ